MSDICIFCRIVQGRAPAYIVAQDEHVVVFLSKENHPLVVPKRHIPNIYSLDEPTGAHVMAATVRIARAVKAGLACEGIYLTQANEPAARQDVFHFHLHVYPRWKNVALWTQQTSEQVTEQDKQDTLRKITARLVWT